MYHVSCIMYLASVRPPYTWLMSNCLIAPFLGKLQAPTWARKKPRDNESRGPAVTIRHLGFRVVGNWLFRICDEAGRSSERSSFGTTLARRRPFFDDVGHLPARRLRRERNLCTLCWGKRAAGESSALQRRRLASSPFSLHEHVRGRLGHLLRQRGLRVADVRVRRRLRGLRPAHAALAPAATGLQPTAPHRVNTSCIRGTPCPLHQHCLSYRNAS